MKHVPRFYCRDVVDGASATLSPEQQHHLLAVLRRGVGDELLLFNEKIGEWRATILAANKKTVTIKIMAQGKPAPLAAAKTILYFGLLEKSRLDLLIPKAVELAASDLVPVISDFTDRKADEWQRQKEKWQKVVVAAVEQSGRLTMPRVHDATAMMPLLTQQSLPMVYGDVQGGAEFYQTIKPWAGADVALLVGPPGGFSDGERAQFRRLPNMHGVHLGANILRSETAAMAMLAGLVFLRKL